MTTKQKSTSPALALARNQRNRPIREFGELRDSLFTSASAREPGDELKTLELQIADRIEKILYNY